MSDQTLHSPVDRFKAAAELAAATVDVIPCDPESVNAAILRAASGDDCILLSEPDDLDPALFSVFRLNSRVVTHPVPDQFRTIPIGVTDAFCAVAATGSVCVTMSSGLTSPASMLTRRHIVLVDERSIVERPRDVFSEELGKKGGLQRSFSFITGPSATADMGPLVRGVHGPGALHIIILAQNNHTLQNLESRNE
ncbi:MAG: LUD domain-containing protein [Acidobacteriota bacterium]